MTTTPESAAPAHAGADGPLGAVELGNGTRVTYTEYGCPDGTPVVVLHGTPGSRRLGRLFETDALEHDVRVLALDRPGFGDATPWPDRSIADAGRFVTAVLDDAGVEAAGLIAFSGGAAHALATAASDPARVTRVDVVSGATPPSVTDATPTVQRLLAGLATATPTLLGGLLRGQATLARRLDPSFVVNQYTTGESAIPEEVAAVVKADFLAALAGDASGAVTEFRNAARAWGVPYAEITVPVRFRHGSADTNVPIDGVHRLADRLPTGRVDVLDGADHLDTLVRSVPELVRAHA